jgi:hypothetical protein
VFGSIRPVGFCGAVAFKETVSSCKTFQSLFEFIARYLLVSSTKGRYLQYYSKNIIGKYVKSRDAMTDSFETLEIFPEQRVIT